jgi:hypothetical protein
MISPRASDDLVHSQLHMFLTRSLLMLNLIPNLPISTHLYVSLDFINLLLFHKTTLQCYVRQKNEL